MYSTERKKQFMSMVGAVVASSWVSAAGTLPVTNAQPRPSTECLRAIAAGRLSARTVSRAVETCSRIAATSDCRARLTEVLGVVLSEGNENIRSATLEGLQATSSDGKNLEARRLASEIALTASEPREAVRAPFNLMGDAKKSDSVFDDRVPPTRREFVAHPDSRTWARLSAYVGQFLSTEPGTRVKEAFGVIAAPDCETALGGQASAVCHDLGLWAIHRVAFGFAIAGLRESRGDPEVVRRYLEVDRVVMEKALLNIELADNPNWSAYTFMLRRWMASPPGRWQAWADIDAAF